MRPLTWLALVVLILSAGVAQAQDQPLGYVMLYNAGPAAHEGVALGSAKNLGFDLPEAGIVVRDEEQELPCQASGDTLAVWCLLGGWEHKRVAVFAGKATATVPIPLRHSEDHVAWMTLGTNYNLRISKEKRGVSGLQLGGNAFDGAPEWDVWIFPPTKDDRKDLWTQEPPKKVGDAADFTCEPLATGPLLTRYRLKWSCEQARVEETVTLCSGEPFVQFDLQTEVLAPISQVVFKYQLPYRFDQANTVFYPLGERVVGYYDGYKSYYQGQYDPAPGWVLGWSPKANGLGFAVPDRGVFTRLAYAVRSPEDAGYYRHKSSEGKTGPAFFLCAQSENLSEVPMGTVLSGTVFCFTQKDPAEAEGTIARIKSPLRLRRAAAVDLDGAVALPAIPLLLGVEKKVTATLRNHGGAAAPASVRLEPGTRDAFTYATPPAGAAIAPGAAQETTLSLTPQSTGPQEVRLGLGDALSRLRLDVERPVAVEKVWPNKVLYANNEEAVCDVTLKNWQEQAAKVQLVTWLRSDLDAEEKLDQREVTLQPLERQTVSIRWNTGKREYGFEIVATVSQAGKVLDSGSEFFGIASDWLKIMQDGSSRYYYHNIVRVHNVQQPDGTLDLADGDYDVWHSGAYGYYGNTPALRRELAALKQNGIKPCFYIYAAATPWGAADFSRDPQKILYTADGHAADEWGVNIYAQGFRDWLVDQFDRAINSLGWEACFLDVSQAPPQAARERFDWQGRPAGQELGSDPDSIGAAWFADLRRRVMAKRPGFTNMHNPEVFKSEFQFPKSYVAAGGMAMIEIGGGGGLITHKESKYGRWDSFAEAFDSIRATKRRYGVENIRSYPLTVAAMGGDVCAKTVNAISLACGFHTANVCYPPGSIHSDGLRNYLQFATRYSALLYHEKIKWIPPEEVTAQVEAPPSVRWKSYVFQRDLGQEVDSLLHLVQLPPDPYIYRRPGRQARLTGLKATVPVPPGASLRDVWLLSPDRPVRAEQLKGTVQGGKVAVTIPDLEVYDILLVRFRKGG